MAQAIAMVEKTVNILADGRAKTSGEFANGILIAGTDAARINSSKERGDMGRVPERGWLANMRGEVGKSSKAANESVNQIHPFFFFVVFSGMFVKAPLAKKGIY